MVFTTKDYHDLTMLVFALQRAEEQPEEEQKRHAEKRQSLKDIKFKELMLERTCRNKAFAYFGPLLRRARVNELSILEDELRATLTPDEYRELFPYDLIVTGELCYASESPDILLVVEISSVVDETDVSNAVRRANLLRKAGCHAIPVVIAGEEVTQDARKAIKEQNVVLMWEDRRTKFWKEAVASWEGIQLIEN